jgi:hypothetical protein
MELVALALYACVGALVSAILVPLLELAAKLLSIAAHMLVFYHLTLRDNELARRMDRLLVQTGWLTSRRMGGRVVPGYGWHVVRLPSSLQWVLCRRVTEDSGRASIYELYSLAPLEHLSKSLFNATDGIKQLWFEPTCNDWQLIRPLNLVLPLPVFRADYPHQTAAVHTLFHAFQTHVHHRTSAIIQGGTRAGKSTTACHPG